MSADCTRTIKSNCTKYLQYGAVSSSEKINHQLGQSNVSLGEHNLTSGYVRAEQKVNLHALGIILLYLGKSREKYIYR